MKLKASTVRKLKYGGTTAAMTALIIAAIFVSNVIFTALSQKQGWGIDLTPPHLYTVSEEFIDLIGKSSEKTTSPIDAVKAARASQPEGEDPLMINIIFCDDPDIICEDEHRSYIYNTAKDLEREFPEYIKVMEYDIIRNPSKVEKYKTSSQVKILKTSVIVEFGTEYRIMTEERFFLSESSDAEPWSYNGEKAFASSILAVTRAVSPLACITVNHGETFADDSFLVTLVDAGFRVDDIDLSTEEIPEECRLLVVFDPKEDFMVKDGVSEIDEIDKIDRYLSAANSMMVFMNPSTPELVNFEEYLEQWGISFDRYTEQMSGDKSSYLIQDKSQSLTADGYTFKADYVESGVGSAFTNNLRTSRPVPKSMIFRNVMSLSHSSLYSPQHYTSSDGAVEYDYSTYQGDGISRDIYDIFVTSPNAEAYAGSSALPVEKATDAKRLSLMTVSVERRSEIENQNTMSSISLDSYVLACGSTDFASEAFLESGAYGNTDFLLESMRTVSAEPVPVGLDPKPFDDDTIDIITTKEAIQYTVVLSVIPAIACIVVGIVVVVRRKYR